MTTTIYLTGRQIGQYGQEHFTGNGPLASLTLTGVRPLGDKNDIFKVVIEQTNGADTFGNGQFVSVYDEKGKLLFGRMNPKHDEFQGRAASTTHQVFSDQNVVIDLHGVGFGIEGYNLLNDDGGRLPFKCFQQAPCFLEGTLIWTVKGGTYVEDMKAGDEVHTYDSSESVRYVTSHLVSEPMYEVFGLVVTGQHRIAYTNADGVDGLIAAKHHPEARVLPDDPQRVYSVFTDRHCILNADGVWCESSYPGPELRKLIGPEATGQLTDVLGDLDDYCAHPAAPFLNKHGRVKG